MNGAVQYSTIYVRKGKCYLWYVRNSESKGPDLELHLRLVAVETHGRERDSAEVPRNLLVGQLELEGREENRQDDPCRTPTSQHGEPRARERYLLISSWENLKPMHDLVPPENDILQHHAISVSTTSRTGRKEQEQ